MDPVNVIRAPSLKRGKADERLSDRIKLKKIIGLTVCSSAGLDVSPTNGVIAYPAGCAVVLFNSKKLSQTYLLNTSRKAITAVAYSQCGRYLATGECGINPTIKVWELELSPGNESNVGGTVIAEFSGHKYAVNCVAFSPTGKYLVSVGSQHDNIVNVFDWKSNLKIASNKVSAKVVAVSFSEDGNYFVTVGNRHVKYWYLEGGRKYKEPIPLMGRSAILGELRNNDFCAVACGKGDMIDSTYAITRNGHLVEFNSRRLLDKWVMCRTTSANCMVASAKLIFVGCADSIIRVFNTETLEYVTTLPRTHYLGVDVAQGVQISHMMSAPQNSKYPDTIAIVFDESRSKVSCVYNDHSLYIWDLRDIRRVGKSHSFLYHSACIWGVETVPSNFLKNGNIQCKLPPDSFLTCSSDDTIRVWGLEQCEANEIYRKNIYSKELLKVIYIDDEMNFIKDMDNPTQSNEKSSSYDGRNGVRCIKVSADYGQLATGDRSGNIRIYNLNTLKLITSIEAHDSEVLCLEYTNDKIDRKLLASASRDRLIHVFDVENGYRILQTLDDHSSSITSVKFIGSGLQFQMISCGADKSIIFRNYQNNQFTRGNNCSAKNTLYDMEVDSTAKHILTACQDRNIRVYGTQNAKHTKTFKGSHSDEGTLIKLSLDLSGIYIATSCTDKTLSVYDYYSGECMAKMYGHSELVTGLKFTNDCKHLISASGDGCIFIWQVPHDMIVTMQARLSQQAMRSGQQPSIPRQLATNPFSDSPIEQQNYTEKFGSPPANFLNDETTSPTYKLSEVGQLPMWAKRKPDESTPIIMGSSPNQNQPQINQKPRGKWAQRGQFDAETLDLRNIVDTPNQTTTNIMISNNTPTSGYNSGGSKDVYSNYLSEDSSIDSGMENRRDNLFMAPKVVLEHNKMHSLNSESNTEHDGDVEDISDGERTSSDHGMIYYPATHSNTPTDFKVNEMKEDELRKSIRRQKLEKQGLSVSQIIAVTASNTGTNTSDDEDDASTPSGDNAERSLASTLGGSSESIPHPSTFLQVALDGPGSLSDHSKDKEKSRKSISAMHNIDNSKTTSLSKSYTNSKKEELLKVINEAKQKLENEVTNHSRDVRNTNKSQKIKVGYKSSLRASQSISDLSHANTDARTRLLRGNVGETNIANNNNNNTNNVPITTTTTCQTQAPQYNYHHQQHYNHNFLNCAAPKAKIAQNCHLIHQIQNNYPPYPSHLGHYYYGQSSSANASPQHRPTNLTVQIDMPTIIPPPDKLKKHPGILKNYKSCPVSPVHEELDWAVVSDRANQIKFNESYKSGGSPARSASIAKKRHTLYSDDAQTILDMIQSDTERMIAEITLKYGDLDDFEPKSSQIGKEKERTSILKNHQLPREIGNNDDNKVDNLDSKCTAKKEKHEHGFLSEEEDGNFSSDSLEDCSLDLDICDEKEKAMYLKKKKGACKKHHKKYEATPPKRSVSEYFIYEDYYTRIDVNRKVSLSDILNDDSDKKHDEQKFLETQRHSSASFFLGHYPNRKSQESILSDDYSGGAPGEAISFCNSMESILSDESECKSAPLEILFEKGKLGQKNIGHIDSKSYGSSPNSTYFDYYMQNQHRFHDEVKCDISNYGFDSLDGRSFKVLSSSSASKSPTHYHHQHPRAINTSFSVPQFTDDSLDIFDDEFIPSLTSKVAQYNTNLNKSLCKDFTNQRINPMHEKFSGEQHPKPIIRSDVFSDAAVSSVGSVIVMKKSCSFEIDMGNGQRKIIKNSKKFEQNLQRFEKERRDQQEQKVKLQKSDFNLEMDYVAHKPPVAHRRASSMKGRGKTKTKEKFNTISCSQTTSSLSTKATPSSKPCFGAYEARDFVNKDYLNKMMKLYRGNDDEKSFEVYIAEKGINEDDNMDSLDSLESRKKKYDLENSVDSLEPSEMSKKFDNDDIEPSTSGLSQLVDTRFITTADLGKFRDIEKKIDIINKLVELEERKLEQERIRRENRVKPLFDGNTKERGFVKHLTKNFDMLAKSGHESINWCDNGVMHSGMKRNYSLPDVLEGAKFQTFEFDDIDEPTKSSADYYESSRNMKLYDFDDDFEFTAGDGEGNKSFVPDNDDYRDENESSIRRACSLSDLSMGKGFKSTATSPKTKDRNASRNLPKRSASSVGKSATSGMGMRSVSVGMLNQASDSDQSEPIASRGGVLRPTISSNNKAANNIKYINPRSAAGIISRRKGMQNSYSSVNLTTTGQDESSSEESPPPNIITSPTKPAVPPRPRNIQSQDQRRITNINTMLNSKKMELAAGMMEMPCKDSDIENADINTQFCSNVINQLMNTANAVLQLHQRLRSVDEPTSTGNNNLMLKELENAVIMTQSVLTKITARNADSSPENSTNGNVNQDRLNNNHNIQSNGEYIQMIDKCSDLLNKVQIQKHVNNNSN